MRPSVVLAILILFLAPVLDRLVLGAPAPELANAARQGAAVAVSHP